MKKVYSMLCFAFFLILACNSEKKQANDQDTLPKSKKQMASDELAKVDTLSDKKGDVKKDYLKIGAEIMERERLGKLEIGLTLDEVLEQMGEPEEKSEVQEWEADGEFHQIYKYTAKGIELDMVGEADADKKISSIYLTAPNEYATIKGISIGSSISDVQKLYEEGINPEDSIAGAIVIGSVYGGLIFTYRNDKVETIFLGARAE